LNCNYTSVDAVAEHFLVSKQALWKRLNNLKRLDLLSSASDKNRKGAYKTVVAPVVAEKATTYMT